VRGVGCPGGGGIWSGSICGGACCGRSSAGFAHGDVVSGNSSLCHLQQLQDAANCSSCNMRPVNTCSLWGHWVANTARVELVTRADVWTHHGVVNSTAKSSSIKTRASNWPAVASESRQPDTPANKLSQQSPAGGKMCQPCSTQSPQGALCFHHQPVCFSAWTKSFGRSETCLTAHSAWTRPQPHNPDVCLGSRMMTTSGAPQSGSSV
jgi:hypothetical protein